MEKLLGKKLYMTSIFDEFRRQVPVTAIQVGPCVVTQVKTEKSDGYNAIQIGYAKAKEKHLSKALIGHFKKAETDTLRNLVEFKTEEVENFKLGEELTVERFEVGEFVAVSGTAKGKGFGGVMKRHGFHGSQTTHGQSDTRRAPGSIGAASDPSRVFKGKKMPGRTGGKRKTVKNLEVVKIDKENNILLVKGPTPGSRNSILEVARG